MHFVQPLTTKYAYKTNTIFGCIIIYTTKNEDIIYEFDTWYHKKANNFLILLIHLVCVVQFPRLLKSVIEIERLYVDRVSRQML